MHAYKPGVTYSIRHCIFLLSAFQDLSYMFLYMLCTVRRRLNICPLLEGEEQLRLLNLQHNMIRHIQHLSALRRLIFLDLYDNMIAEISGLQSLVSLRVLMLGKNRCLDCIRYAIGNQTCTCRSMFTEI